jgi:hypothetical protein
MNTWPASTAPERRYCGPPGRFSDPHTAAKLV